MDADERNEGFQALVTAFHAMAPDHRRAFVEVMTWLMARPKPAPEVAKWELLDMIDAVRARNALQAVGPLN